MPQFKILCFTIPGSYSGEMETNIHNLKDKKVFKFGAKSGLTIGQIASDLTDVTFDEDETFRYSLYGQLEVKPNLRDAEVKLPIKDPETGKFPLDKSLKESFTKFAKKGDSGCPVYCCGDGKPVLAGILIAGHSNGNGFVTFILEGLRALNLDDLQCFQYYKNSTPTKFFSLGELRGASQGAHCAYQTKQHQDGEELQLSCKGTEEECIKKIEDEHKWEKILSQPLGYDDPNSITEDNILQTYHRSQISEKCINAQQDTGADNKFADNQQLPKLSSGDCISLLEQNAENEESSDESLFLENRNSSSRYSASNALMTDRCSYDSGYSTQTVSSKMLKKSCSRDSGYSTQTVSSKMSKKCIIL